MDMSATATQEKLQGLLTLPEKDKNGTPKQVSLARKL